MTALQHPYRGAGREELAIFEHPIEEEEVGGNQEEKSRKGEKKRRREKQQIRRGEEERGIQQHPGVYYTWF